MKALLEKQKRFELRYKQLSAKKPKKKGDEVLQIQRVPKG